MSSVTLVIVLSCGLLLTGGLIWRRRKPWRWIAGVLLGAAATILSLAFSSALPYRWPVDVLILSSTSDGSKQFATAFERQTQGGAHWLSTVSPRRFSVAPIARSPGDRCIAGHDITVRNLEHLSRQIICYFGRPAGWLDLRRRVVLLDIDDRSLAASLGSDAGAQFASMDRAVSSVGAELFLPDAQSGAVNRAEEHSRLVLVGGTLRAGVQFVGQTALLRFIPKEVVGKPHEQVIVSKRLQLDGESLPILSSKADLPCQEPAEIRADNTWSHLDTLDGRGRLRVVKLSLARALQPNSKDGEPVDRPLTRGWHRAQLTAYVCAPQSKALQGTLRALTYVRAVQPRLALMLGKELASDAGANDSVFGLQQARRLPTTMDSLQSAAQTYTTYRTRSFGNPSGGAVHDTTPLVVMDPHFRAFAAFNALLRLPGVSDGPAALADVEAIANAARNGLTISTVLSTGELPDTIAPLQVLSLREAVGEGAPSDALQPLIADLRDAVVVVPDNSRPTRFSIADDGTGETLHDLQRIILDSISRIVGAKPLNGSAGVDTVLGRYSRGNWNGRALELLAPINAYRTPSSASLEDEFATRRGAIDLSPTSIRARLAALLSSDTRPAANALRERRLYPRTVVVVFRLDGLASAGEGLRFAASPLAPRDLTLSDLAALGARVIEVRLRLPDALRSWYAANGADKSELASEQQCRAFRPLCERLGTRWNYAPTVLPIERVTVARLEDIEPAVAKVREALRAQFSEALHVEFGATTRVVDHRAVADMQKSASYPRFVGIPASPLPDGVAPAIAISGLRTATPLPLLAASRLGGGLLLGFAYSPFAPDVWSRDMASDRSHPIDGWGVERLFEMMSTSSVPLPISTAPQLRSVEEAEGGNALLLRYWAPLFGDSLLSVPCMLPCSSPNPRLTLFSVDPAFQQIVLRLAASSTSSDNVELGVQEDETISDRLYVPRSPPLPSPKSDSRAWLNEIALRSGGDVIAAGDFSAGIPLPEISVYGAGVVVVVGMCMVAVFSPNGRPWVRRMKSDVPIRTHPHLPPIPWSTDAVLAQWGEQVGRAVARRIPGEPAGMKPFEQGDSLSVARLRDILSLAGLGEEIGLTETELRVRRTRRRQSVHCKILLDNSLSLLRRSPLDRAAMRALAIEAVYCVARVVWMQGGDVSLSPLRGAGLFERPLTVGDDRSAVQSWFDEVLARSDAQLGDTRWHVPEFGLGDSVVLISDLMGAEVTQAGALIRGRKVENSFVRVLHLVSDHHVAGGRSGFDPVSGELIDNWYRHDAELVEEEIRSHQEWRSIISAGGGATVEIRSGGIDLVAAAVASSLFAES